MKSNAVLMLVATALAIGAAPMAHAAKPSGHKAAQPKTVHHNAKHQHSMQHKAMHHQAKAKAKGSCKAEFMYMKGGKCMDARAKSSA
jgi:Ni/Co efflux regulator RcnB